MDDGPFLTNVPARLDRLRWSSFHSSLIAALGTSWIIDGLEVTLVGSLASVLTLPTALGLTPSEVGEAAGAYVAGAVMGAVLFGGLADRYGRRRLFFVTLGVYAAATIASGLAPNFPVFLAMRFLTGAGIGGEYAAINSAIQEFMPARLRGRVDLAVNGASGSALLPERRPRYSSSIRNCSRRRGAGASRSSSAVYSHWGFFRFDASSPRARAGSYCSAATARLNASSWE